MQKALLVLPLLILTISPALAASKDMKMATIKSMYDDAIEASRSGQDEDTLDTLFKYSDKSLQNAVALSRISRMTEDGDLAECHDAFEALNLGASNGWSLDEAKSIDYSMLNDGKVRANIKYTGKENIRSSDFISFKDFSLQCNADGNCKVTDVFDYTGYSGKSNAEELCR